MGETRVRLLEAVGREGSISAAARAVGLSYKAAWDAVDAMNNLFGRPLVGAQTGGRKGGGN
ncbi:MAG TPA: LysR family transcriptional regulator, partial [Azospirillaceae bacterium]|nr:LysR family transcriptional regulator [Azospirillaceae bacterium]